MVIHSCDCIRGGLLSARDQFANDHELNCAKRPVCGVYRKRRPQPLHATIHHAERNHRSAPVGSMGRTVSTLPAQFGHRDSSTSPGRKSVPDRKLIA
jgi:hypothetical protein